MKKSIILMMSAVFALCLVSCSKNSGTSHLTDEEKRMKKHVVSYIKEQVKSYNTLIIEYAKLTNDQYRLTFLDDDLAYPQCSEVVKVYYSYGKKGDESVDILYLQYTYLYNGDLLFLYPLDYKYHWLLKDGVMDWKMLWMEDR